MAENLFERARRVVGNVLEDGVERLEKANAAKLMKQAVRDVDYAIEDAQAEYDTADRRKAEAEQQAGIFRTTADEWREKAEYALSKDRDDLAEAAMIESIDCKKKARRLNSREKQAAKEMDRLRDMRKELLEKRAQLQSELDDYLAAERKADAMSSPDYEKKISDILKRFENIMDMPLRSGKADGEEEDSADMQESDDIDARLAELKNAMKAKQSKTKNPR